ncbi:mediator of RNA polymerase II transcription subunit 1 [Hypomesus transpacificus]|uniref:mediator of RNA polymerase II transcription subunit 1 n=1 Tax=Hypomesus transpacificus TaxID=137520 RepID=UPI001F07D8EF|nr:mediator of RNA polymerase II transcription subunit 1 [Hypomesus transpacificus]
MDKSRGDPKPCEPLVRCLKRLHEVLNVSVSTLSCMVSRLEMVAKQRGMGSYLSPSETTCYLTADLFYLEVLLLTGGGVEDVKVAQHGEAPVSSESLLKLLRSQRFEEFSGKLEGLASLYNIPGDNETKVKIFTSLQHLGRDLQKISHLPRALKEYDPQVDIILNGRLGYLTVGREGCPMSIQFFVSPSDILLGLLGPERESVGQVTLVTVGPSESTHKLQMTSLLPQPPQLDSQGDPVFSPLSEATCEALPAYFLLKLQQPLPVLSAFINKINQITGVAIPEPDLQWAPLPQLLMELSGAGGKDGGETLSGPESDTFFIVSLPGEVHSYVVPGTAWAGGTGKGAMVGSIPFTHPAHVPALLEVLRHQCTINTLLASCGTATRRSPGSACDLYCEVLPVCESSFSVTFHLSESDSLAVLVVNVEDPQHLRCSLFASGLEHSPMDEYISKVLKRCLSIPVTMRALNGKLDKRMIPQTPPARVTPLAGATSSVLVSLDAVSPSVTEPGRVQSPPSATISQSVPGADAMAAVSASEYYLMSVTASQPVSDSNTSLPANPYPCVSVGVCPSHWIASSNHLPELI